MREKITITEDAMIPIEGDAFLEVKAGETLIIEAEKPTTSIEEETAEGETAEEPKEDKVEESIDSELWASKINTAEGSIIVGDGTYEMDSYGTYKDQGQSMQMVDDIFGSEYVTVENWMESAGLDYLIEEMDIDTRFSMEVARALDEAGLNEGRLVEDNTYNWSWLGPWDIQFSTIEFGGGYITFFEVHQGGDVRGNYSDPMVYVDYYEMGFLEKLLNVFASISIKFNDGGSAMALSQQDSDIWYFEVQVDRRSDDADAFVDYCDDIGQGSDLDEFLADLLSN